MSDPIVDVMAAADPVAVVLDAHARGASIALRTSGTTSRPRSVVRTAASWVDSFPAFSGLTGVCAGSRVWVPGPLSATMNLFAAVHARWVGATVTASPEGATHAQLTPAALAAALDAGTALDGVHAVVAGDRLGEGLARRAAAAGVRTSSYYGAAELSFVAWGSSDADLRPFPGVEVSVRDGCIWARSPWLSQGYAGEPGPLRIATDGSATVGDRGRLRDGVLTVTGRDDGTVVTAGATVVVSDVEQALRRATGCDLVVLGVEHPRLGARLVAVVADREAHARAFAAARSELSRSHRPVRWYLSPELPLTAAGKVDRPALAALVSRRALTGLPPPGRTR